MTKYVIQRVLWIGVILFIILSMTFILLKLDKDYPPNRMADKDQWLTKQVSLGYYTVRTFDKDDPEAMREIDELLIEYVDDETLNSSIFYVNVDTQPYEKLFYAVSIGEQYVKWLDNVFLHWEWGDSTVLYINQDAWGVISERIPLTFSINIVTLLFYMPIGLALGIVSALRKDGVFDNIMQILIMVFISLPSVIVILALIVILGYELEWVRPSFPILLTNTNLEIAKGYILPVLAGGLPAIAGLTRLFRAELSEVLTSEFVTLAKTKGLTYRQSVLRHAIRNSLVPMVPTIIGSFAGLLGGSFILESLYSIPGVGRVTLRALTNGTYDFNLILVGSAFYSAIGLFAVLLVDLSYGIIDPQIRMGAKK